MNDEDQITAMIFRFIVLSIVILIITAGCVCSSQSKLRVIGTVGPTQPDSTEMVK